VGMVFRWKLPTQSLAPYVKSWRRFARNLP